MKKRFCIIIVVFFFIYYSIPVNAQFVQGIGITAGATYAHQKWLYSETNTTRNTSSKFGFNGSFFLEMVDNYYWRWVSEIQYNRKGAIEKPDLLIEGEISDYNITPTSIGAATTTNTGNTIEALQNKLTITIKVHYENSVDPTLSFDRTYSDEAVFNSDLDINTIETAQVRIVNERIINKIYNDIVANW